MAPRSTPGSGGSPAPLTSPRPPTAARRPTPRPRPRPADRRPRGRDGRAGLARDRRAADRAGRAGPRPRAPVGGGRLAGGDHGDRVPRRLGHRASDEHAGPPRRPAGGGLVKPVHSQLPKGARIYLPDEAARKRYVEGRLLDVFARWGYREIVTPTFEFADVLAMGTDLGVQESMFKFVDRETGRMLALRADITPQIARVVATRLRDEPKPVRLAYVTNVFRHDEPQMSHYREFYQAGVELIGLEKPEAEVEVIAMTIEGLRALGLDRFQIDLGHPDFFRGLLEEASADTARRRALRDALARKDASTLERLVRELAPPPHVAEALLALPTLFGREIVLERGRWPSWSTSKCRWSCRDPTSSSSTSRRKKRRRCPWLDAFVISGRRWRVTSSVVDSKNRSNMRAPSACTTCSSPAVRARRPASC